MNDAEKWSKLQTFENVDKVIENFSTIYKNAEIYYSRFNCELALCIGINALLNTNDLEYVNVVDFSKIRNVIVILDYIKEKVGKMILKINKDGLGVKDKEDFEYDMNVVINNLEEIHKKNEYEEII